MKKKIFVLVSLIVLSISVLGATIKVGASNGDDYIKVWDSGGDITNPVFGVEIGDTDKDGKPEIIVADFSYSGSAKVYVFENTGDNSYQPVWDSGTTITMRISRVAIGDQDSDGNLEIIAAGSHDIPPHNAKIYVFENVGDNDYQEVWNSGSDLDGMEITSNFIGDADNDGKGEIIIGAGSHWSVCKLRVYENTGDNAYQEVWNSGNTTADSVSEGAVGDTDGDGKREIIVGSGGIERVVRVFENIGDNSYGLVSTISGFGKSPQVVIGDQDKDGRMEIIVGSQEGEWAVRVFEHTGSIGDNTYTEVWNSGPLDGRIFQPAIGDQDNDGKRDIVAPCVDACKVYLFENTGDNDYQEVWNSGDVIGGLVQYVATGDQDRDGKGEIIVPSYDGKVYVFEINYTPTSTQEIFEDFSACNSNWLEYDPENKIEIDCTNDQRLELNHWIRYEPGYVYRPFSTADFVLEYDINITDHGGNGKVVGPGFSDTLGTLYETQNGIFSVFYAGWPGGGGIPHLDLQIYENGTQILDWTEFLDLRISRGTTYYVRVEKFENKVTFSIFSDISRTSHISGSPKTFYTNLTNTTFDYFYAVNGSYTSPIDNWEWTTGWIDNIHVKKEQIPIVNCLEVGKLTLCADSITQSGNVYTLSGNVNINKRLWFSGDVTYIAETEAAGTLTSSGYPYVKLSDGYHKIFAAIDITYHVNGNVSKALGTLEPANLNDIIQYELSIAGLPLGITSDPITINNGGVLIGGRIVIGSGDVILCGVDAKVLYKPGTKAVLAEANLAADISSTVPWLKTTFIELNYDSETNDLTGTAGLSFPYLGIKEIEAAIVVHPTCIDGFKISAALAKGIPLGTTGLEILGLTMEVDNICGSTAITDLDIFFGGDLGITGVPTEIFSLERAGFGYSPYFILNIEGGNAKFLGNSIASLRGHLDADSDSILAGPYVQGNVHFGDFYTADIKMLMLAKLLIFLGESTGTLQIPDFQCDGLSCVIKSIIEMTLGELPYKLYNQEMYIYVSPEDGNWKGSLKGMVSAGNFKFAAALIYENNELHFSIGFNYEDMVRVLDNGKLHSQSRSVEQSLTFPTNRKDVIFAALGNSVQPQIYLKTPNGETVTSNNFGNFNGVSYMESNKHLVTLFNLESAAAGTWTMGVSNLSSSEVTIKILSKRPLSQTSFTRVTQSGDKVSITASANPTETDTKIGFYFSKWASGGTGAPIVENLPASSGTVSTEWNTNGIATGTYYIFAKTTDELNPPLITYYTSPLVINNSGIEPPTDLQGTRTGSTVTLTWKPSESSTVIGYNVLYTDERYVGGYKYQESANFNDLAVIENLDLGKEYCFCVVALDNNGNSSIESNNYCTSELGTPEISLNRTSLTFGAVSNGTSTSSQSIFISNNQNGTLNWTSTSSESWLQVSPGSGTGEGVINIGVNPIGLGAGTYTGTISISDPNAINSPQTVTVTLNVYPVDSTLEPFGKFATPIHGTTVMSSIPVTGWVLDDIGVESVKIYRIEGKDKVYIGDAVFIEGARPDVEQAYPTYPNNYKAGWGYMLLTNFLPNNGNGTFTLHAIATDIEGNRVTLGTKTILVDNANAVKPFGAIDTPTQGGTASGSNYRNWGWVLTPQPNMIPTNGSTINVWVDGIKLGHPAYNVFRSDIASLFPGYANSNGAAGYFDIDTSAYNNDVHTIQWTATDNGGNTDGIGSRYFTIQNTGSSQSSSAVVKNTFSPGYNDLIDIPISYDEPVKFKKGYTDDDSSEALFPDTDGITHIQCKELEMIDIQVSQAGIGVEGYMMVGNRLKSLPVGSTLEKMGGRFRWIPGPGFVGTYSLVFIETNKYGEKSRKNIQVTIEPKFSRE